MSCPTSADLALQVSRRPLQHQGDQVRQSALKIDAILLGALLAKPVTLFKQLRLAHLRPRSGVVEVQPALAKVLECFSATGIGAVTEHGHSVSAERAPTHFKM